MRWSKRRAGRGGTLRLDLRRNTVHSESVDARPSLVALVVLDEETHVVYSVRFRDVKGLHGTSRDLVGVIAERMHRLRRFHLGFAAALLRAREPSKDLEIARRAVRVVGDEAVGVFERDGVDADGLTKPDVDVPGARVQCKAVSRRFQARRE